MAKYTIGGDPGLDGAIALYDGINVSVWDMPTLNAGSGGKRVVDRGALFDRLAALADAGPVLAAVEQVSGVRNQSAHSSCEFGKSAGYLEMAVIGNKIPILLVPPRTWKAHFRIPSADTTKARKALAREKASSLMPSARALWARAGDDGRAESALLALYAYHHS